jgi:hypothetical protein
MLKNAVHEAVRLDGPHEVSIGQAFYGKLRKRITGFVKARKGL